MRHTENKHVVGFKAVHDNVLAHGHATASNAEIFIAGKPDIREAGKRENRSVMESISRLAISMLPLSFAV